MFTAKNTTSGIIAQGQHQGFKILNERKMLSSCFLDMDNVLKYRIVEKIIQCDDEALLNEIKSLVGLSEVDFWEELPAEIKQAVNKAKTELDQGEGIQHDQVMEEVKKRFLNR
ncbi:MAG TPA: hypothetical protein VEV16_02750 [Daejeonella sp.]|nr:hypothetical protein [Daejeonella sp.]